MSPADPPFALKELGPRTILYVMAAEAEYGPCLEARFAPLTTGVGPVEAGVVLAGVLARLHAEGRPPGLVVSLGSAGSRTLAQTGIYQAKSISYRDMDASPLGFEKGVTPFLGLPAETEMPVIVPDIPRARLSTGGNIVSGAAYEGIDADMVDMESYAHLRACTLAAVPLIVLRGISDGATELSHIGNWTEYLHVIDEKLGHAVDRLEAAILGNELILG